MDPEIREMMTRYLIICAACLIWFSSAWAGDQTLVISPSMQMDYAVECFDKGDFETALVELKRYLHFFPTHDHRPAALFLAGQSLYELKRLPQAAEQFQEVIALPDPADFLVAAWFMLSKVHSDMGQKTLAQADLHNILMLEQNPEIRNRVYSSLGWIYLEKAEMLDPGALEKAKSLFAELSGPDAELLGKDAALACIDRLMTQKRKRPVLAGILSIIPGGGYVYCERYRDGLVAFLFNAALIAAACSSFDQGNPALGGVVTAIESGFYAGNIYGGVSSAHKYNQSLVRKGLAPLRRDYPGFIEHTDLKGSSPAFMILGFTIPF